MPEGLSEEETKQLLKSLIDHVAVGRWLSIVVALLIVVVFLLVRMDAEIGWGSLGFIVIVIAFFIFSQWDRLK